MLRTSIPDDLPQLYRLWADCFGDRESDIALYFTHYWKPERMFVLERDGAAQAMCAWFSLELAGQPAAYFYAVATAPAYQGRGFCRRLMAYAEAELEQQGISQFLLVPGGESLFQFYQKIGYCTAGAMGSTVVETPRPGDVRPISPEEYLRRRNDALPPNGVRYSLEQIRYQQRMCQATGGDLFALGPHGCAAADRLPDATLLLKEVLGCAPALAGSWLLEYYHAKQAAVRFPHDGGSPFCMGKNLSCRPCYLGLAFD